SILQALPVVLDILQQPKIGTQTVLPIDPKLAMTSDVTESVNSGKSNDAAERVWKRLKTIADANKSKVSADEESLTKRDIKSKLSKGWTESDIVSLLRNTEHISPGIPVETALARM